MLYCYIIAIPTLLLWPWSIVMSFLLDPRPDMDDTHAMTPGEYRGVPAGNGGRDRQIQDLSLAKSRNIG